MLSGPAQVDSRSTGTILQIDLKQVNISIGVNQDLLVDAHLKLKEGVHYGVSGSLFFLGYA